MMERLGFNTATVPWAELYTGLQIGVVDGQIGGTPEMALDNFKDVTKTWIQYNDHFEPAWFVVNRPLFESMPEADQKALVDAAQEVTKERFAEVEKADPGVSPGDARRGDRGGGARRGDPRGVRPGHARGGLARDRRRGR